VAPHKTVTPPPSRQCQDDRWSGAWVCRCCEWEGAARVVASQGVVLYAYLSALCRLYVISTVSTWPSLRTHFPPCAPVDPEKGSRGNSKVLPNSDELEAPASITMFLLYSYFSSTNP
jgi:hypothetical protein